MIIKRGLSVGQSHTDALLAHNGAPVWPVGCPEDAAALADLAAVFGSSVEEVDATPASGPEEGPLIIGLTKRVSVAGRLYAHLTSRTYRTIASITDLPTINDVRVLICLFDDLTPDLFDVLERYADHHCHIGIISAATPRELLVQVRLRAAARHLSREYRPRHDGRARWIDLLPAISLGDHRAGDRWVLGSHASRSGILASLAHGADILRVVTHSDGIDADLGAGLALCDLRQHVDVTDAISAPRCAVTGICHRAEPPRVVAECDHLVSPDIIRCGIAIWQVCLGVLDGTTGVDAAWGIGRKLITSPTIGAVITTSDFVMTGPLLTEGVISQIAKGMPIGQALDEHHRSTTALSHRLFIFGDPDVALPEEAPGTGQTVVALQPAPPRTEPDRRFPAINGSDIAFFTRALVGSKLENAKKIVAMVGDRFDDYPWSSPRSDEMTTLRRLIADYIAERNWVRLIDDWWGRASDVSLDDEAVYCCTCGQRTTSFISSFAGQAADRRLSVCRRCAPIEDAPAHRRLTFRIASPDRFEIAGDLPVDDWEGRFVMFTDIKAETLTLPWPRETTGRPASSYRFSGPWPPGPLRVGACFVSDSWQISTVPFRFA